MTPRQKHRLQRVAQRRRPPLPDWARYQPLPRPLFARAVAALRTIGLRLGPPPPPQHVLDGAVVTFIDLHPLKRRIAQIRPDGSLEWAEC